MSRWHVSKSGEPGECNAPEGECPLGGQHFTTPEKAAAHYESQRASELFSPKSGLLTNDLSDAHQPQVNPIFAGPDGKTLPESMALEEQSYIEGDIKQHKKAVSEGHLPITLTKLSKAPAVVTNNGDSEGYTRAMQACDYDRARRIHAEALVRQFGGDPTFRYSADDILNRTK